MRTLLKTVLVMFAATQMIACTKENAAPAPTPVSSNIAGDFEVSLFRSIDDQTATFQGYTFEFNGGTIKATKDAEIVTGTFTKDDDGSNEFKIRFSSAPLNKLNKGWLIESITADKIALVDDNPSGDDRLEFRKHN